MDLTDAQRAFIGGLQGAGWDVAVLGFWEDSTDAAAVAFRYEGARFHASLFDIEIAGTVRPDGSATYAKPLTPGQAWNQPVEATL